jgi:hypothetical protein
MIALSGVRTLRRPTDLTIDRISKAPGVEWCSDTLESVFPGQDCGARGSLLLSENRRS